MINNNSNVGRRIYHAQSFSNKLVSPNLYLFNNETNTNNLKCNCILQFSIYHKMLTKPYYVPPHKGNFYADYNENFLIIN